MNLELNDHYSILELPPSATTEEIKKSYRRLAHAYHPDKNDNDPYAAAQFAAVKEAYETLMDPVRKDHYLQKRWYAQSAGKKLKQVPVTPVMLFNKLLELDQYVSKLDVHRMDYPSLHQHLAETLSDEALTMLHSFNEPSINNQILLVSSRIAEHLPYPLFLKISDQLRKVPAEAPELEKIDSRLSKAKSAAYWEKRRPFVMLIIVILLCVLIYLMTS